MPISHVIFDAFGTLVRRPNPLSFRQYPIPNATMAMREVRDWYAWAEQCDARDGLIKDIGSIESFPDTAPTLDALQSHRISWSVMSNLASCYGEPLEQTLRRTHSYTPKHWFLSYKDGLQKPAPRYYNHAVRTIGLHPESILFVGDHLRHDVEGPMSVGMNAVHANRASASLLDIVIPWLTCYAKDD